MSRLGSSAQVDAKAAFGRTLAANIRRLAAEKGVKALGERAGLSQERFQAFLDNPGQVTMPTVHALAKALGVELHELLEGTRVPEDVEAEGEGTPEVR